MFDFSTHLEIKRQLRSLVNEYVDFTNEIMKKYSFSQDGSQLQFYIKRIKVTIFIRYPKEIMKMVRHFSVLQRWLQK